MKKLRTFNNAIHIIKRKTLVKAVSLPLSPSARLCVRAVSTSRMYHGGGLTDHGDGDGGRTGRGQRVVGRPARQHGAQVSACQRPQRQLILCGAGLGDLPGGIHQSVIPPPGHIGLWTA